MKTSAFFRFLICCLCPILAAMAEISLDQDALVVEVSAQVRRVKVEKKTAAGKWELIGLAHTDGRAGKVKIRLPQTGLQLEDLRVTTSETDLLPFTTYLGRTEYRVEDDLATDGIFTDSVFTAGVPGGDGAKVGELAVEESDIWKRDGSVFYFFNRVRGLQRIDASDPAHPLLTAQYSIPASGDQLYLLPGQQVVLLAYDNWGSEGAVVLVDASDPAVLRPTFELPLRGYIRESRLVGSILYVVSSASIQENENSAQPVYKSVSIVTRFDLSDPAAPAQTGEYVIDGYSETATASPEHLLVATRRNSYTNIDYSLVTVFAIGDPALDLAPIATVATWGYLEDKFKFQVQEDILTTISYRWSGVNRGTILENFQLQTPPSALQRWQTTADDATTTPPTTTPPPPPTTPPPVLPPNLIPPPPRPAPVLPEPFGAEKLAELILAPGERLFATRLLGDTAYIVTFLIKDPLFVIDLSDPRHPRITGQLDIPGYSTFLIPHNGRLIGVGIENWTVTVCLFDVSDPTKPTELRRLHLNTEGGHSWSEANYEDKAVSFLPEQRLLLLPVQGYDKITVDGTDQYRSFRAMQLITLLDDDNDGSIDDLQKEGQISHQVTPRRATTLDEKTVASISNREFLTIDCSDRQEPLPVGDLLLSWPLAKVIQVGDHLIQFLGSGYNHWYWDYYAGEGIALTGKAVITTVAEPWKYSAMVDLGKGTVVGAQIDRDWLLVLSTEAAYPDSSHEVRKPTSTYRLATYALDQLPELPLLGESTHTEEVSQDYAGLLSATSTGEGNWFWYGNILAYSYWAYDFIGTVGRMAPFGWSGSSPNRHLVSTQVDGQGRPQVLDVADLSDYFTYTYTRSLEPLPDGTHQDGTEITSISSNPAGGFQFVGNRAFFGRQTRTHQYKVESNGTPYSNYEEIQNIVEFEVFPVDWANRDAIQIGQPVSVPGSLQEAFPVEGGSDVVFLTQRNYLVREETVNYSNGNSYLRRITAPLFEASLYDGFKAYLHSEYRYPETTYVSQTSGGETGLFVQTSQSLGHGYSYSLDHFQWSPTNGLHLAGKVDFANYFNLQFFRDDYLVVTQNQDIFLYQPQADGSLPLAASGELGGQYYYSLDENSGSWQLPVDAWIVQGEYGARYVSFTPVGQVEGLKVSTARPLAKLAANTEAGEQWSTVDSGQYWLDSCANSGGVGRLVERDWLFRPHDYRALSTNVVDHGDTYMASAWFGEYLDLLYPWIGHRQHGWLLVSPDQTNEAFFFWQSELGWMWTSASVYPFLYSWDRQSWLFYWVGSGENGQPRYFFNLNEQVWKWESVGNQ